MIRINTPDGGLIGDSLSQLPWMKHLCDQHETDALVTGGFNPLVADVLGTSFPFSFGEPDRQNFEAEYAVSVHALWEYHTQAHMSQVFFRAAGKPEPELPLSLDLKVESPGIPPGVVISPYSVSNSHDNNKLWPHERWIAVVQALRDGGRIDRTYVVGASGADDPAPYVAAGIEPVFDRPLAQVLGLMRQAELVFTVDNGISHLAHYGGVDSHVLLYPGCLPECWVRNPNAVIVRAPWPIDVSVSDIIRAAKIVMGRPHVA